jgi:hypothetical protein
MRGQRRPAVKRRIAGPKGGKKTCIRTLLYCSYHGQYSGYVMAMTRAPVTPCPHCHEEQVAVADAAKEQWDATGVRGDDAKTLARAAEMLGRPLKRYHRG